jgi:hypothetical protein
MLTHTSNQTLDIAHTKSNNNSMLSDALLSTSKIKKQITPITSQWRLPPHSPQKYLPLSVTHPTNILVITRVLITSHNMTGTPTQTIKIVLFKIVKTSMKEHTKHGTLRSSLKLRHTLKIVLFRKVKTSMQLHSEHVILMISPRTTPTPHTHHRPKPSMLSMKIVLVTPNTTKNTINHIIKIVTFKIVKTSKKVLTKHGTIRTSLRFVLTPHTHNPPIVAHTTTTIVI